MSVTPQTSMNIGNSHYVTQAQFNELRNDGNLIKGDQYYITDEDYLVVSANEAQEKLKANSTAVTAVDISQVRNIYAGTEQLDPTTNVLSSGDIYLVYEV